MATQQVLMKNGTSFVWATSAYSPAAGTSLGTYSATYQLSDTTTAGPKDLAAAAGAQSIKADLGNPRALEYQVDMTFEPATDPAAGGYMTLYWSHSESATAANGNIAYATGVAGAYAASLGVADFASQLNQLQLIGIAPSVIAHDGDGVQIVRVGRFTPMAQYGQLIIVNNMSVALHSDAIEFAVRFMPIFDDIQAAA